MSYLVLRRKNGSIRLLLPAENHKVMRSALQMYYPSRLLGHIYKSFKLMCLPLLSKLNLIETVDGIEEYCPHLEKILKNLAFADIKVVGVLVSDVGLRSKSTVKIMNLEGDELAYARIAQSPESRKVIDHESEVLKALVMQSVKGGFPQILSSGAFDNPQVSYSVQSVGPNQKSKASLTLSHFNYLDSLVKKGCTSAQEILKSLKCKLDAVVTDNRIFRVLDAVFQELNLIDSFLIVQAIEHGDFAPWNLREEQDGSLFVFDWEHANLDGLVWMDALHFTYQVESLVKRKKAQEVYESLIQVFDIGCYSQNVNKFSEAQRKVMMTIYLLKSILMGHKEGCIDFENYLIAISVMNIAVLGNKVN